MSSATAGAVAEVAVVDSGEEMKRWHQATELFRAARELPPDQRTAFLDERCAGDLDLRREVESFLAGDEGSGDTLEAAVGAEAASLGDERGSSLTGRRIGPYQLFHPLGHGGMGSVYLAARVDDQFCRQVAIKLIKPGMDSEGILRRFRNERQILAGLDHPNVARLFDGGTTREGLPYFVMEYIDGEPIDRYCDGQKLTIGERLELFCTVCSAVHSAHQNLVVHRDLKPGNILVTAEGEPKLLDFGIAKLLNPELAAQTISPTGVDSRRPMTPDYASPEQLRGGPITTASDVYTLGKLLYELLTGHRPYRLEGLSLQEIKRVVCEIEPEKPSTTSGRVEENGNGERLTPETVSELRGSKPESLRRKLSGDLDNIVLMAMRKEPQRRYASARELADDIRRHLSGQPVIARPSTFGYRAGKFVRRNKLAVAFVVLLVVFAAGMTVQSIRADRQRAIAEEERARAEEVTRFLVELFQVSDPSEARGRKVTARELLDKAAGKIGQELGGQPQTQATLMHSMGSAFLGLGLYADAEPLIDRALAIRQQLHRGDHPGVAESLHATGRIRWAAGEPRDAAELFLAALQMRVRLHDGEEDHLDVAESQHELAKALFNTGDQAGSEKLLRTALATRRRWLPPDHPDIAKTRTRLAEALRARGDMEGAEKLLRQVLETGPAGDHAVRAKALDLLGELLVNRGDEQGAEEVLREALQMRLRLYGPDHHSVAESHNGLALMFLSQGRYAAAEEGFREAMRIMKLVHAAQGGEHWLVALTTNNLARSLHYQCDYEGAERLYREALRLFGRVLGESHPYVAMCLRNLASSLIETGDFVEAEALAGEALEIYRGASADPPSISAVESTLGGALAGLGRYEEAQALLERSYRVLKEDRGERYLALRDTLRCLVRLYEAWGKLEKAAEYRDLPGFVEPC